MYKEHTNLMVPQYPWERTPGAAGSPTLAVGVPRFADAACTDFWAPGQQPGPGDVAPRLYLRVDVPPP